MATRKPQPQETVIADRILPLDKETKNTVRFEDNVLNVYVPFLLLETAGIDGTPRAVRMVLTDASDSV